MQSNLRQGKAAYVMVGVAASGLVIPVIAYFVYSFLK